MTAVAMVETHAPIITPLRDWLRTQTAITATTGQQIYAGAAPSDGTLPMVVVSPAGRGVDVPMFGQHLVQIDCWVSKDAGAGAAETLAVAVENTLRNMLPATLMTAVRVSFVSTESALPFQPEPDGTPRYVLTVLLAAKATGS